MQSHVNTSASVQEKRRETEVERSDEKDLFQVSLKKLWSRQSKRLKCYEHIYKVQWKDYSEEQEQCDR
jgi:hypothetical protein